MPQGRLQIRSSLVAFAPHDCSFLYVTASTISPPAFTTALAHSEIVLDLEPEVLAEMLGVIASLNRTLLGLSEKVVAIDSEVHFVKAKHRRDIP